MGFVALTIRSYSSSTDKIRLYKNNAIFFSKFFMVGIFILLILLIKQIIYKVFF